MAASASMHPTLVGSNLRCAPQSSGRKRASGPHSGSTAPTWVSQWRGMPFAAGLLPICSARAPQSVISFWRGPGGRAPSSATSAARRWTRGLRPTLLRRTAPASWRRSSTSPGRMLDPPCLFGGWQGVCPGGLASSRSVFPVSHRASTPCHPGACRTQVGGWVQWSAWACTCAVAWLGLRARSGPLGPALWAVSAPLTSCTELTALLERADETAAPFPLVAKRVRGDVVNGRAPDVGDRRLRPPRRSEDHFLV